MDYASISIYSFRNLDDSQTIRVLNFKAPMGQGCDLEHPQSFMLSLLVLFSGTGIPVLGYLAKEDLTALTTLSYLTHSRHFTPRTHKPFSGLSWPLCHTGGPTAQGMILFGGLVHSCGFKHYLHVMKIDRPDLYPQLQTHTLNCGSDKSIAHPSGLLDPKQEHRPRLLTDAPISVGSLDFFSFAITPHIYSIRKPICLTFKI